MKVHLSPMLVLVLAISATTYADRVMGRTEALGILQKLSATPTSTWIPAGTIEANHEEYKAAKTTDAAEIDAEIQRQINEFRANPSEILKTAELQKLALEAIPFNVRYEMSNEYKMTSSVTLKYDGDKFYWAINVASRTDSVDLPSDSKGNFATRQFNMGWNGQRIFAWDGQKYTIYTVSANQAIVDAAGTLPRSVNGPLTAGIIPWGRGTLASKSLNSAATAISAAEVNRDGQTQVEMTVQPSDGSTITFVLDPAKDYAVTAYTWRGNLNKTTSNYYSGYQKIGDKWVPTTILAEQRDFETNRLLKSDKWDLTIDAKIPRDFSVTFNTGARIEYYSPASEKPAVYNYSNATNTDRLLAEQVTFSVMKDKTPQNCATAALKHVASQLGKSISDKDLAKLVGSDGKTSLYALKQAAQGLGLNPRAVKIDLTALRSLDFCKVILHIPGKNHFVVLDSIAGQDAWLADISSEKFYYRTSADLLPIDWSEGTALLLSTQPITASLRDIENALLSAITGGTGWSCTHIISGRHAIYCDYYDPPIGCDGYMRFYYPRMGCEPATTGTCYNQYLPWFIECLCLQDPIEQYNCYGDGNWEMYYIPACA